MSTLKEKLKPRVEKAAASLDQPFTMAQVLGALNLEDSSEEHVSGRIWDILHDLGFRNFSDLGFARGKAAEALDSMMSDQKKALADSISQNPPYLQVRDEGTGNLVGTGIKQGKINQRFITAYFASGKV